MIVNMGGRGSCRAVGPRKLTPRQELRPSGIGSLDDLPKSATAPPADVCRFVSEYYGSDSVN